MSDSLWPHGLQHARLPCPWPTPGGYSDSCPSSRWCHPTISSSVIPFSSHLQSFPALGSFPVSQFFASGGQSIKSFSFSISPSNEYSGLISFRIDWFDLLAVHETLKSHLQHHSSRASILQCSISQDFLWAHNIPCWLLLLLLTSKGFLPTPNHWWKWSFLLENVNFVISIDHYELPLCFRIWFSG